MSKEKEFIQEMEQEAFRNKYEAACRLVADRLEQINKEISEKKERQYIKDIEYRVKTPDSCLNKMKKKGYALKLDTAREKLNDIAGVRAVCYFLDDVYQLADLLIGYHDFEFVKKYADYVILLDKTIVKEGTPEKVLNSKEFIDMFGTKAV